MLEGGLREFDSGPPGRSVRHHTDVVDRLDGRSGDDEDTHVLKVPRPETSEDPRYERLHVRQLRLVLLPLRLDQFQAQFSQPTYVRRGRGSVHHILAGLVTEESVSARTEAVGRIGR